MSSSLLGDGVYPLMPLRDESLVESVKLRSCQLGDNDLRDFDRLCLHFFTSSPTTGTKSADGIPLRFILDIRSHLITKIRLQCHGGLTLIKYLLSLSIPLDSAEGAFNPSEGNRSGSTSDVNGDITAIW